MSYGVKFEGTILPQGETTFLARTGAWFRPNRLRVLRGLKKCHVAAICIGNRSQFSGPPVPAAFFAPEVKDTLFTFDSVPPNVDITLVVENHSDRTVVFEAELVHEDLPL